MNDLDDIERIYCTPDPGDPADDETMVIRSPVREVRELRSKCEKLMRSLSRESPEGVGGGGGYRGKHLETRVRTRAGRRQYRRRDPGEGEKGSDGSPTITPKNIEKDIDRRVLGE